MEDEPVDCPNCRSSGMGTVWWEKLNDAQTIQCHCECCGYTWIVDPEEEI